MIMVTENQEPFNIETGKNMKLEIDEIQSLKNEILKNIPIRLIFLNVLNGFTQSQKNEEKS
jgi:hypothetical protein